MKDKRDNYDVPDIFSRSAMILGEDALKILHECRVAVFGVGGVGGHAAESLIRSGVGTLDIIDKDTVSKTNLNRQIIALQSTIGLDKTDVLKQRLLDINPRACINDKKIFFLPETACEFDFSEYDYVVDAIDTVTGKLQIIESAHKCGTSVISCMGMGNKLDPSLVKIDKLENTSICPLARVMRKEVKARGITGVLAAYSTETPLKPKFLAEDAGSATPGSTPFVPAVAGLMIGARVIKDLISSQLADLLKKE